MQPIGSSITYPLPRNSSLQALDLYTETVDAIGDGCRRLAIWGPDAVGVELLGMLARNNMLSLVCALVTDAGTNPEPIFGVHAEPPEVLAHANADVIVLTADADKERHLRTLTEILRHKDTLIPRIVFAGLQHYEFRDPQFAEIVRSCPVKSKAGGYAHMLIHLYQALRSVGLRRLNGHVVEFGVFQGGTTVFMAKVLEQFGHPGRVIGFDTFSGFPPARTLLDLYRDSKCEFADFEAVQRYCAPHNIDLIQGDIADTHVALDNLDLALSFFDTDNYSAARAALPLCVRRTVVGGFIAFDHFYSPAWLRTIGERIAASEVLDSTNWLNLHGTGIFVRLA